MPSPLASGHCLVALFALTLTATRAAESADQRNPFGFRAADGARHLQLEASFDSLLDAKNMEQWMQQMTTRPHHAGSPKARENAEAASIEFGRSFIPVPFLPPQGRKSDLARSVSFTVFVAETVRFSRVASWDGINSKARKP
jgi:hypothetical protein